MTKMKYHADVIVSHLHDTMYHADMILHLKEVLDTEKKYLADVLSLDPYNTVCVCAKIPFQIIFAGNKFS